MYATFRSLLIVLGAQLLHAVSLEGIRQGLGGSNSHLGLESTDFESPENLVLFNGPEHEESSSVSQKYGPTPNQSGSHRNSPSHSNSHELLNSLWSLSTMYGANYGDGVEEEKSRGHQDRKGKRDREYIDNRDAGRGGEIGASHVAIVENVPMNPVNNDHASKELRHLLLTSKRNVGLRLQRNTGRFELFLFALSIVQSHLI